jgi:hypothetical protein
LHVAAWTWALGAHEVEAVSFLVNSSLILSASLVLDHAAYKHHPKSVLLWQERFGRDSIRVCKSHAKILRMWTADYRLLLRGSFNLNLNPRFEQFDLSEGGPEFDLVASIESSIPVVDASAVSAAEATVATGAHRSWDMRDLAGFGGVKPWKP